MKQAERSLGRRVPCEKCCQCGGCGGLLLKQDGGGGNMYIDDIIGSFQDYTSVEQKKKDKKSRAPAGKRAPRKTRAPQDVCVRGGKTFHIP